MRTLEDDLFALDEAAGPMRTYPTALIEDISVGGSSGCAAALRAGRGGRADLGAPCIAVPRPPTGKAAFVGKRGRGGGTTARGRVAPVVVTSRFLAALVFAVTGTLSACLFWSGAQFVVLAMALLALFAVFCAALWSRAGGSFSPFDLGIVFAAAIVAYSALPLFAFALTGFPETGLDDFADARLLSIRVTEDDVAHVGLLYGSLLLSFCAAYYATSSGRPTRPPPRTGIGGPRRSWWRLPTQSLPACRRWPAPCSVSRSRRAISKAILSSSTCRSSRSKCCIARTALRWGSRFCSFCC